MAPAMPITTTIDEKASERLCHAFAGQHVRTQAPRGLYCVTVNPFLGNDRHAGYQYCQCTEIQCYVWIIKTLYRTRRNAKRNDDQHHSQTLTVASVSMRPCP